MEKTVYKYLIRYSLSQQVWLTALATLSFPFLYAFYELPKRIINEAIQGDPEDFPIDMFGFDFDQTGYLLLLCCAFLILVLINQAFKYYINVYQGLTGERMLRRLRFQLFSRVLRFPQPTFKNMSQGEIIPMITAEVEPLGGFIGEAFALPAFQGGTLIVILAFLFYQNWILAGAAVALYPIQLYLIPRLQMRVNALGKERVRLVRRLSNRIGEAVQGVPEVHIHDTSQFVLADFSDRLGHIFQVRYRIYRQKFVIKFINNFIQQLGPFFFYSLGGYLVISGGLEMGTLVAAIAAHKDLGGPWKELLGFYQRREDSKIKYDQVIGQFNPVGMPDEGIQTEDPESIEPLTGDLTTANLTLTDEVGDNVVDAVSLKISMPSRVAIVGESGSGTADLVQLLSRLLYPTRGGVSVGGREMTGMPEAITGRRLAYVGQQGYVFAGSLGFNLLYGLNHRPVREFEYDDEARDQRKWHENEASAAGNTTLDIKADWVDMEAAGADSPETLQAQGLRALEMVGLDDEVYRLGLRGAIDPKERGDLAEAILRARTAFREHLKDDEHMADLIEVFDRSAYNTNATMGENLLFGNIVGDAFDMERLAENPYMLEVLEKVGLTERILQIGYDTAATMVEIFADVPPDHELFQQYSFVSAEELGELQQWLTRVDRENLADASADERSRIMSLPFKLIPARHRLGMIDDEIQSKVLDAREVFARDLPEDARSSVEFFDLETYASTANIQDNIIFGRIVFGRSEATERVSALITEVITTLGLRDTVVEVGLGYDVGVSGSRLSSGQRQKLAIARSILKRPDIMFLSEATAALDTASQGLIMRSLLEEYADRGLVWVLHKADLARDFDYVLVMRSGKIVEEGTFEELNSDGTYFKQLLDSA
jgi:putative ABC transport system ATP-binding protein